MQNENIHASTKKALQDSSGDDIEKEKIHCSNKRDRDDSPENMITKLVKIRKKSPQGKSLVKRNTDNRTNGKSLSKTLSKDSGADPGTGNDGDDFLSIQNDGDLLNQLMGDFFENDTIIEQTQSKENPRNSKVETEKTCESIVKSSEKDSQNTLPSLEEFDSDFDGLFDEEFHNEEKEVDLENFCHCKVLRVEREREYTGITVKDLSRQRTASVLCYGFWRETEVEQHDVVSLKAKKHSDYWIIDNQEGFLVTQPYNLISGTSVVGAHFCMRRSVLADRFRGLDALPNLEIVDYGMTVGTFVHELLQKVLRKKISSETEIQKIIDELTSSRRGTQRLYEANLSLNKFKGEMESYIPKIIEFVKRYITGEIVQTKDKNFEGIISDIREIEENIWSPELGLKGKIDVTVEATVKIHRRIMPLEVKTGRVTFSADHRGQLILYSMMLSTLGEKIDSGLLLYISENVMHEIKSIHPEKRDLIMLRNSLANYISKSPKLEEIEKEDGGLEKVWNHLELPEPISFRSACAKCPYNTICALYAKKDRNLELSDSHILRNIAEEAMNYLTPEHIDYVFNWIQMLRLEDMLRCDTAGLRDVLTMEPRQRERRGACICNLDTCGVVVEKGNKFLHTFVRKDENEEHTVRDLNRAPFTLGDYIIVSTDTRINVAAGYLTNKTADRLELLLDRDVVRQNPTATFHLDRYPYAEFSARNFSNVACLLNNNEITNKLRCIIIDKKPASFVDSLPRSVAETGASILFRLNKDQRKAILSVLSATEYLLIKGMPGTGKTQTLVALVQLLVKLGRSVLITAHTHSAIDNILLKLDKEGVDFLRLGSETRIHSALIHKSEDVVTANCDTPESLDATYRSKMVIAVTCYGATHSHVATRIFDVCLIDESTQVLQPTILRPIYSASKFVLIGDPKQLPPVIRNDEARKMGMNESLFRRLDSENNTVSLRLQYRMNRRIMSIANELTYEGDLKAANEKVATATLNLKDKTVLDSCERWIAKALSLDLEDSAVMLNTGSTHDLYANYALAEPKGNEKKVLNFFEAAVIARLTKLLLDGGLDDSSIGIICPFTAQVELLRRLCKNFEVNTVDQYQGRDKQVIIYSCTRSLPDNFEKPREFEILEDHQRLNVAVTRAKHKLIIVGDESTLKRFTPFEKLFNVMKDNIIDLTDGRDDFSWGNLVPLIKQ